jgi:hypothetical protein
MTGALSLHLRRGVRISYVEAGAVLLDEKSGKYWQLNASGGSVVRCLLDGGSSAQAARLLVDQFDVKLGQAVDDVQRILDELLTVGLILR